GTERQPQLRAEWSDAEARFTSRDCLVMEPLLLEKSRELFKGGPASWGKLYRPARVAQRRLDPLLAREDRGERGMCARIRRIVSNRSLRLSHCILDIAVRKQERRKQAF